jgi:uncharacterized membrane protein
MKELLKLIGQLIGAVICGLVTIEVIFSLSGQDKFPIWTFIISGLFGALIGWTIMKKIIKRLPTKPKRN